MKVDKFTPLTPALHDYVVEHSSFRDATTLAIEEAAEGMGARAEMQIPGDQAALMTVLARAIGARRALEIGTFLGYGAIAIARGLPEDGELICCEIDPELAERARAHVDRAGLGDRVEIRVGPALETVKAMPEEQSLDICFIDADKTNYGKYYEQALLRLRPGGLILLDNALFDGMVLDGDDQGDVSASAIAALNDRLARDDRVDVAMLSVADGIALVRKR
jgi:predicted O-methyltransferase YrrM